MKEQLAARQLHLDKAASEGFRITPVRRLNRSGTSYTSFEGMCPAGHGVAISLGSFARGGRCSTCYIDRVRGRYVTEAISRGYQVRIELRPTKRTLVSWLVGLCPRGHDYAQRIHTFGNGARCLECQVEDERAPHLAQAAAEGYVVDCEWRVNRKTGWRQSWLVGSCPAGHPFEMLMANFGTGRRCGRCCENGFKMQRPGQFYVICGMKNGRKVVKYGICNVGSTRLAIHARRGFDPEPLLLLEYPDGQLIWDLEVAVKRQLRLDGIASCREKGESFDGASETFSVKDLRVKRLIRRVRTEWANLSDRLDVA